MTLAAAALALSAAPDVRGSPDAPHLSAMPDTADATATESVSIAHLYRQMWTFAAGARGWLLLSSVLLVASQLVKLAVPWFTAQAIETLQRGGAGAAGACLPWVGGIVGVYVVCWSMHGPGRVIERRVSLRVRRALTDRLYMHLSEAPLAWHGTHHPAELAHRMSQATHALANFTQSQFIYLQNTVNLAGPMLALWWLSHLTGAAALLGFATVAATIVAFDHAMMRLAVTENRAERAHAAALLDCLSNITTVLALRLQQTTRRLLARRLETVVTPIARSITLAEWKWCAVDLLGVLLSWGLVALYAWGTQRQSGGATGAGDAVGVAGVVGASGVAGAGSALLLGGVFMVYQYAQQAGGVIGSLASNLQNFTRIRTDFASAAPIWAAPRQRVAEPAPLRSNPPSAVDASSTEPTVFDASVPEGSALNLSTAETSALGASATEPSEFIAAATEPSVAWRHIDLCDLSYLHPGPAGRRAEDAQPPGLHRVSLRLYAGERIALVGPSGSGKSTLLRVLAGLCEPSHGHVEIDGVASLGVHALRSRATLIPQEAQVFEATLRENVAFDLGHDDAEITRATRVAALDSVVDALPLGLDTPIAQGGSNLSGGQRQRLCLTRGVLAARRAATLAENGSAMLLLDEPTSALDPVTEAAVLDRLCAEFARSCVVASVHRMSLLDRFDRVALLVQGRIVDIGSVAEVSGRQRLFRDMLGAEARVVEAA